MGLSPFFYFLAFNSTKQWTAQLMKINLVKNGNCHKMGGQGKDTISVYNIHSTVAGSSIQVYSRWFEYWTSMVTDTLYWFQTRPFLFLVCWSEKGRSSENLRNSRRQSLKMMGSYTRQHFSGPGISGIRQLGKTNMTENVKSQYEKNPILYQRSSFQRLENNKKCARTLMMAQRGPADSIWRTPSMWSSSRFPSLMLMQFSGPHIEPKRRQTPWSRLKESRYTDN